MSALTDLLLATTDPVVAIMLVGLAIYIKRGLNDLGDEVDETEDQIRTDIRQLRDRVQRMESVHIPDGGEVIESAGEHTQD